MAFVVSQGRLTGLSRPASPAAARVRLSETFSADYAALYRAQPHVRTVISFLARNIAQIGLHVYERVSDTDRKRLTKADSPLAALLATPNPRTTRYRWMESLVSDLGIYDVACHVKLKADDGGPGGLLRLPPSQIEPVGDTWQWADKVRFNGSRGRIDFDLDQVLLIHGYHPTDSRWGLSPMETLRQTLAEDYQAALYREQMWRNGARLSGVIKRPQGATWSTEAREKFRQDWRGLYAGEGPAAGGTPILEDGMDFSTVGITPEQAQYLEVRKLSREEVAAAFHVPPPMVGILDHATFSNITEQHKNLYQDTLGPWLAMIEQELMLQVVPEFDTSGRVYVEFNLAEKMKGSFEEQATSLQTAVGGPWLTRNEARARQNLPQVDGGDELIVPLNVLTGGQASPTDAGAQNVRSAPVRRVKSAPTDDEVDGMEGILSAFFKRQRAVVLTALGVKAAGDWWDAERWNRELGADLLDYFLSLSAAAASRAIAAAGGEGEDFSLAALRAYLQAKADGVAEDVNETTKAQIEEQLATDEPDVAHVFDVAEEARATAAAVTLTTAIAGFATVEAARQTAGPRATKTWRASGVNTRSSHARMNGETVGIEEKFSNGMRWPGDSSDADEVANCRCTLTYTYPEREE